MKKSLLKIIVIAAIFFVITEIALRVTGIGHPLWTKPDIWTGWRLRPNASGWQTDEGRSFVNINAQGWRDPARSLSKPENTLRIAVLGDAFIEGRHVHDDGTMTRIAEKALGLCESIKGRHIEVLNFGVSGFGTVQELLTLQQYVWPYSPDIVVLAFTPGNDVRSNSLLLNGPAMHPMATLSGSELTLDMGFRELADFQTQMSWYHALLKNLVNDSHVLQILYGALHTKAIVADSDAGADWEIYKKPSGLWVDAWNMTDVLFASMLAQVRLHKAGFLLMTTTTGIQMEPLAAKREAFIKEHGVDDLFYAEKHLQALGGKENFPVLALGPILLQKAEVKGAIFHGLRNAALGMSNWNAEGHRAAGEVMAQAICEALKPDR